MTAMPAEQHEVADPAWFDLFVVPRRHGGGGGLGREPGPPSLRINTFGQKGHNGQRQTVMKIWLSVRVREHFATLGTPCVTLLVWPPDELCATAIERIMLKGAEPPHGWRVSKTGYMSAAVLAGRIKPGTSILLEQHGLEFVGDVPKEARLQ